MFNNFVTPRLLIPNKGKSKGVTYFYIDFTAENILISVSKN